MEPLITLLLLYGYWTCRSPLIGIASIGFCLHQLLFVWTLAAWIISEYGMEEAIAFKHFLAQRDGESVLCDSKCMDAVTQGLRSMRALRYPI